MPVWEIIIFLLLVCSYFIFYWTARTRKKLWMALNLLYGLWIMQWFGTRVALSLLPHEKRKIYVAIATYSLGMIVHHLVVMWGKRGRKIDFIHGPVSHLLVLASAGWLLWAVGKILFIEQSVLGIFYWVFLIICALGVFWMAFDKKVYVKLAKKSKRFKRLAENATM